eukprot:scaffold214470_cov48-Attheya_sp.AAC.3
MIGGGRSNTKVGKIELYASGIVFLIIIDKVFYIIIISIILRAKMVVLKSETGCTVRCGSSRLPPRPILSTSLGSGSGVPLGSA